MIDSPSIRTDHGPIRSVEAGPNRNIRGIAALDQVPPVRPADRMVAVGVGVEAGRTGGGERLGIRARGSVFAIDSSRRGSSPVLEVAARREALGALMASSRALPRHRARCAGYRAPR